MQARDSQIGKKCQKKNIPTTREVVGTSIVKVKLCQRKCEAKFLRDGRCCSEMMQ